MCRYHPERSDSGACATCGNGYCDVCAVPFGKAREDIHCLDCGAQIAHKRVRIVHITAVAGFALGLFMAFGLIGDLMSQGFGWGSIGSLL